MDDDQFRNLLDYLNLSWKGYRKVRKGVKKRIIRHMQKLGCRNFDHYFNLLNKDDDVLREYLLLMTVSISRFFRDKKLWETLRKDILPDLIEKNRVKIKVWSSGCASGEEVYSIKMIYELLKSSYTVLPSLEIIATDINPEYIKRAETGIYRSSSLREVPDDLRKRFFTETEEKGFYKIDSHLKDNITWCEQSIFSDPPTGRFEIIFLRNNLLTYYNNREIKTALSNIPGSLSKGGYLITGSHERLPYIENLLSPSEILPFIFRKKDLVIAYRKKPNI